jgi:hypothetical protein
MSCQAVYVDSYVSQALQLDSDAFSCSINGLIFLVKLVDSYVMSITVSGFMSCQAV